MIRGHEQTERKVVEQVHIPNPNGILEETVRPCSRIHVSWATFGPVFRNRDDNIWQGWIQVAILASFIFTVVDLMQI